jgi:hypothetical protein
MPEEKYTLGDFFSQLIGMIVLILVGVNILMQVYLYEQRTNAKVIGNYTENYYEENKMKTILNKIGTILSQKETIELIETVILSEVLLSDKHLAIVEVRRHAVELGRSFLDQHVPNAPQDAIDAVNELVLFEFEEVRKDMLKALTEPKNP